MSLLNGYRRALSSVLKYKIKLKTAPPRIVQMPNVPFEEGFKDFFVDIMKIERDRADEIMALLDKDENETLRKIFMYMRLCTYDYDEYEVMQERAEDIANELSRSILVKKEENEYELLQDKRHIGQIEDSALDSIFEEGVSDTRDIHRRWYLRNFFGKFYLKTGTRGLTERSNRSYEFRKVQLTPQQKKLYLFEEEMSHLDVHSLLQEKVASTEISLQNYQRTAKIKFPLFTRNGQQLAYRFYVDQGLNEQEAINAFDALSIEERAFWYFLKYLTAWFRKGHALVSCTELFRLNESLLSELLHQFNLNAGKGRGAKRWNTVQTDLKKHYELRVSRFEAFVRALEYECALKSLTDSKQPKLAVNYEDLHVNQRRIISYAFDQIVDTPIDEQPHLLTTLVSAKIPQPAWTCIYSTMNTTLQDMNLNELAKVVNKLNCPRLPYIIDEEDIESIVIGISGLVKIRTNRSRAKAKEVEEEEPDLLSEAES
ncbi:unnamed protein product [Oikopleura dioica]|uniref:Uncharacterized protein n=1 Tax=Oikopleura dioica TaxID=34765 RepID=E4XDM3_OIKDI|nr:unnamed protein product [Oikopleura dioica]